MILWWLNFIKRHRDIHCWVLAEGGRLFSICNIMFVLNDPCCYTELLHWQFTVPRDVLSLCQFWLGVNTGLLSIWEAVNHRKKPYEPGRPQPCGLARWPWVSHSFLKNCACPICRTRGKAGSQGGMKKKKKKTSRVFKMIHRCDLMYPQNFFCIMN